MATHRRFKSFRINEISAVDRPAQKGARVAIMKRADELTPELLAAEIAKSVGALIEVYDEIQTDESGEDKHALLQKSFDQFKSHLQGIVPEGVENATVALALTEAGFELTEGGALTKKEDPMAFDIKKSLGLPATATDAEIEKALKALGARDELATFGANVAKMSSDHLAYMKHKDAHLPKGGEVEFAAMKSEERDEIIKEWPAMSADDKKKAKDKADADSAADAKKRAEGDEVLKVGTTEIRKSVVGESAFAVMKAQQEDIVKMRDAGEVAVIEKRVAPMVNIGKADEVASVLHRIAKHDPKLSESVEAMLKAADARIAKGELFSERGKASTGAIGKAADTIEAAAKELQKNDPRLSIFKARDQARKNNPELAKQEEQERKDANGKQRAA